jgi:MFS family permease
MTVPPNVLASIGIASGAWLAARIGRRAPLIIGSAVVAILGMPHCGWFPNLSVSKPSQVTLSPLLPRPVCYFHG